MSIRIMSAVWEIDLPDSEKLVLLALADCANDEGHCWPSMKTLANKCSKSDRTVQATIKRLVEAGHLSRVETVGKGCHYYVHPDAASEMEGYQPPATHYTYRITDEATGEFYVGARSCYGPPETDTYIGSGEWVKETRKAGRNLTKVVLQIFPSRGALAVGEQELTRAVISSPLCRNRKTASAKSLSNFGGLTPEATSPRSDFAPKRTTLTPEATSDKPSVTISSDAKASSPRARKADPFPKPEGVDPQVWLDFLANRKRKRMANTATAHKRLMDDLQRLADAEWPIPRLLEYAAAKGWGGIYDPRADQRPRATSPPSASSMPFTDYLTGQAATG